MSSDPILLLSTNLSFVDEMYERFARDPQSVDASWRELFRNGHPGAGNGQRQRAAAPVAAPFTELEPPPPPPTIAEPAVGPSVWPLVNAYRVRGHLEANLDPLGLLEQPPHPELEPATYGFRGEHYDAQMPTGGLYGMGRGTLHEIIRALRTTYCSSIGLEFMHISTPLKKAWLAERMETRARRYPVTPAIRRAMLRKLIESETFETFCHTKYPGTKRFSLQGSESLIPLLDQVLDHVGRLGAREVVLGMAHRGRLSVLTDVLGKPAREVFAEFDDIEPEASFGGGDVKYHLGYSGDRVAAAGHELHLSLTFNPSHLEAVDPVVVGRVRAKQRRHKDATHERVVGLLIHGDAAFAGQGLVPETLNFSALHGYRTGGTVHVIVNNQIGFTASPMEARSTPYCTDVAKLIQCPIWHVNGEDLDAVAQVCAMAMEYRAQFHSDVVIDMFCYRKYGHNEMDEPAFTQPLMYRRIQQKEPVASMYARKLADEGVATVADVESMRSEVRQGLERELEAARASARRPVPRALGGVWAGFLGGPERDAPDVDTGVPMARLREIAERLVTVPRGFTMHRTIQRLFGQRAEMGRGERPLDWAMAELLAFATAARDGYRVRLSGQDSSRGTFSHRHAVVTDQETGIEHCVLDAIHPEQADCSIYDSPLSEAGVLGFEFGYSLDYPDALVMWEAQFGDFANGAQVIIDQFVCASEDKWKRLSGLVMLLPHGFEGQGPEHSSARLERFLEACGEDNWQICQPTTPAQMFHMLRRQVVRPWRKPLIVMTPKSLLRHPEVKSELGEFAEGRFRRVLPDPSPPPADGVDRVFLCTGRVYYDLVAERAAREDTRTALVRVEQLYPWPADEVVAAAAFPGVREVVWVQDEPVNMGAWNFVRPRLKAAFPDLARRVCARDESASPATGSSKAHAMEQRRLLDHAFGESSNG